MSVGLRVCVCMSEGVCVYVCVCMSLKATLLHRRKVTSRGLKRCWTLRRSIQAHKTQPPPLSYTTALAVVSHPTHRTQWRVSAVATLSDVPCCHSLHRSSAATVQSGGRNGIDTAESDDSYATGNCARLGKAARHLDSPCSSTHGHSACD